MSQKTVSWAISIYPHIDASLPSMQTQLRQVISNLQIYSIPKALTELFFLMHVFVDVSPSQWTSLIKPVDAMWSRMITTALESQAEDLRGKALAQAAFAVVVADLHHLSLTTTLPSPQRKDYTRDYMALKCPTVATLPPLFPSSTASHPIEEVISVLATFLRVYRSLLITVQSVALWTDPLWLPVFRSQYYPAAWNAFEQSYREHISHANGTGMGKSSGIITVTHLDDALKKIKALASVFGMSHLLASSGRRSSVGMGVTTIINSPLHKHINPILAEKNRERPHLSWNSGSSLFSPSVLALDEDVVKEEEEDGDKNAMCVMEVQSTEHATPARGGTDTASISIHTPSRPALPLRTSTPIRTTTPARAATPTRVSTPADAASPVRAQTPTRTRATATNAAIAPTSASTVTPIPAASGPPSAPSTDAVTALRAIATVGPQHAPVTPPRSLAGASGHVSGSRREDRATGTSKGKVTGKNLARNMGMMSGSDSASLEDTLAALVASPRKSTLRLSFPSTAPALRQSPTTAATALPSSSPKTPAMLAMAPKPQLVVTSPHRTPAALSSSHIPGTSELQLLSSVTPAALMASPVTPAAVLTKRSRRNSGSALTALPPVSAPASVSTSASAFATPALALSRGATPVTTTTATARTTATAGNTAAATDATGHTTHASAAHAAASVNGTSANATVTVRTTRASARNAASAAVDSGATGSGIGGGGVHANEGNGDNIAAPASTSMSTLTARTHAVTITSSTSSSFSAATTASTMGTGIHRTSVPHSPSTRAHARISPGHRGRTPPQRAMNATPSLSLVLPLPLAPTQAHTQTHTLSSLPPSLSSSLLSPLSSQDMVELPSQPISSSKPPRNTVSRTPARSTTASTTINTTASTSTTTAPTSRSASPAAEFVGVSVAASFTSAGIVADGDVDERKKETNVEKESKASGNDNTDDDDDSDIFSSSTDNDLYEDETNTSGDDKNDQSSQTPTPTTRAARADHRPAMSTGSSSNVVSSGISVTPNRGVLKLPPVADVVELPFFSSSLASPSPSFRNLSFPLPNFPPPVPPTPAPALALPLSMPPPSSAAAPPTGADTSSSTSASSSSSASSVSTLTLAPAADTPSTAHTLAAIHTRTNTSPAHTRPRTRGRARAPVDVVLDINGHDLNNDTAGAAQGSDASAATNTNTTPSAVVAAALSLRDKGGSRGVVGRRLGVDMADVSGSAAGMDDDMMNLSAEINDMGVNGIIAGGDGGSALDLSLDSLLPLSTLTLPSHPSVPLPRTSTKGSALPRLAHPLSSLLHAPTRKTALTRASTGKAGAPGNKAGVARSRPGVAMPKSSGTGNTGVAVTGKSSGVAVVAAGGRRTRRSAAFDAEATAGNPAATISATANTSTDRTVGASAEAEAATNVSSTTTSVTNVDATTKAGSANSTEAAVDPGTARIAVDAVSVTSAASIATVAGVSGRTTRSRLRSATSGTNTNTATTTVAPAVTIAATTLTTAIDTLGGAAAAAAPAVTETAGRVTAVVVDTPVRAPDVDATMDPTTSTSTNTATATAATVVVGDISTISLHTDANNVHMAATADAGASAEVRVGPRVTRRRKRGEEEQEAKDQVSGVAHGQDALVIGKTRKSGKVFSRSTGNSEFITDAAADAAATMSNTSAPTAATPWITDAAPAATANSPDIAADIVAPPLKRPRGRPRRDSNINTDTATLVDMYANATLAAAAAEALGVATVAAIGVGAGASVAGASAPDANILASTASVSSPSPMPRPRGRPPTRKPTASTIITATIAAGADVTTDREAVGIGATALSTLSTEMTTVVTSDAGMPVKRGRGRPRKTLLSPITTGASPVAAHIAASTTAGVVDVGLYPSTTATSTSASSSATASPSSSVIAPVNPTSQEASAPKQKKESAHKQDEEEESVQRELHGVKTQGRAAECEEEEDVTFDLDTAIVPSRIYTSTTDAHTAPPHASTTTAHAYPATAASYDVVDANGSNNAKNARIPIVPVTRRQSSAVSRSKRGIAALDTVIGTATPAMATIETASAGAGGGLGENANVETDAGDILVSRFTRRMTRLTSAPTSTAAAATTTTITDVATMANSEYEGSAPSDRRSVPLGTSSHVVAGSGAVLAYDVVARDSASSRVGASDALAVSSSASPYVTRPSRAPSRALRTRPNTTLIPSIPENLISGIQYSEIMTEENHSPGHSRYSLRRNSRKFPTNVILQSESEYMESDEDNLSGNDIANSDSSENESENESNTTEIDITPRKRARLTTSSARRARSSATTAPAASAVMDVGERDSVGDRGDGCSDDEANTNPSRTCTPTPSRRGRKPTPVTTIALDTDADGASPCYRAPFAGDRRSNHWTKLVSPENPHGFLPKTLVLLATLGEEERKKKITRLLHDRRHNEKKRSNAAEREKAKISLQRKRANPVMREHMRQAKRRHLEKIKADPRKREEILMYHRKYYELRREEMKEKIKMRAKERRRAQDGTGDGGDSNSDGGHANDHAHNKADGKADGCDNCDGDNNVIVAAPSPPAAPQQHSSTTAAETGEKRQGRSQRQPQGRKRKAAVANAAEGAEEGQVDVDVKSQTKGYQQR